MTILKNALTFILLFWFIIQAAGFTKSQLIVNRLDKDYDFNRPNIFVFDTDIKEYYKSEMRRRHMGKYIDRSIPTNSKESTIEKTDIVGIIPKQIGFKKKDTIMAKPDIKPENIQEKTTDTAITPSSTIEHKIIVKKIIPPK